MDGRSRGGGGWQGGGPGQGGRPRGRGRGNGRGNGNGNNNHRGRGGNGRGNRGGQGGGAQIHQNEPYDAAYPDLNAQAHAQTGGDGPRKGRGNHNHNGQRQRGGGDWRQRRGSGHQNGQGDNRDAGNDNGDGDQEDDQAVPRRAFIRRERKFDGPVFGFKRLYKFLDTAPNDVLLSIDKDKDDWKALLESDKLTTEMLIVAIDVLGEKVCVEETVLEQQRANSLTACCSKIFAKKLEDALPKICNGSFLPYRRNNASNEYPVDSTPIKVTNNIHQFCAFVIKTIPNLAVDYFQTLICTAMGASLQCDPTMGLLNKFKLLNDQIQEITTKQQQKEETNQRRKRFGFDDKDLADFDSETPPDDIKDIEVIPSIEELRLTAEPYLRPNKETGAYSDAGHYIDVQFRLLREDFVRPLREGIRKFLKNKHEFVTAKKRMPLGEVRLYTEVMIEKVVKERDAVVYKLKLAEAAYKRIKWEKSKRLLTGCLVVLTATDRSFQQDNTHFGVVFSRNTKELEKGVVTVTWESTPPAYNEEEEYLMFESEVYLEAYRYTLETLKTLELDKFPMKKFIVDACSSVDSPKYLKDATKQLRLKLLYDEDIYVSPQQHQWPTAAEFGLDENQLQAFQAAITKEFSIIQGPPGTGKTFLGLKIAEVLLNNAELWTGENGNPITIVCYTNHALDQFLEGILRYYQKEEIPADIIRIGGRCKSVALDQYTLRNVRTRLRQNRKLPKHYWAAERGAKEEIYDLEDERASRMSEVTGLQDLQGIVDFEKLSAWSTIQVEYPQVVWNCFQKLSWFGIGNEELKREKLSEDAVAARMYDWFQIRNFPKVAQKNKGKSNGADSTKVERNTIGGNAMDEDDDFEDDEDYDMDELMEGRLVDDILLEAETSQQMNMGNRLSYLPDSSIASCDKSLKQMNKVMTEATRDMNQAQAFNFRESKRGDLWILENRKKYLAEVFRLYQGQLIDLPDVSEMLEEIRKGGAVLNHLSRLRMSERWALYFAVVNQARHRIAEIVAETEKKLSNAQRALRQIIQFGDGLILQDCKVVGLTTTGAAKYNNLLRMMQSKIVIVEEAAEVFEAHIVTCITESCEQLILIGDHRQLRPSPTVYNLATKYNLDLSLFERMINNNLHCYPLKMQHRMRPDISDLVAGPIYNNELENHESVKHYPDVKGLKKNVFFITHTEKESSETDSMSKSNKHEAQFVAALCRHLVLQGYEAEQITVLTMYMGQMFLLKKEIGNTGTCKGVRVTSVDNYQGEENDIILLSLVRSNTDGKIGFLSIDNRICVSLSRAKHGLYVIGNMDQMVDKSKTWRLVKDRLDAQEAVGEALELECQIHRTRTLVTKAHDFQTHAPEGGCSILCDTMLACTHTCKRVCHVIDKDHEKYKCREPCKKMCGNDAHPCKGMCFEQCPLCMVRVVKTLNCEQQHERLLPCHRSVEGIVCNEAVLKRLPCSHEEVLACHVNIHDFICKVKVEKTLPCSHTREMECHVDPASIRCKVPTEKLLPCEHTQVAECWFSPENVKCKTMVAKKFAKCGHEMQVKCHERNLPAVCKGPCTIRLPCGHACVKTCHTENDPEHQYYECRKPCSKECQDGHKCKSGHNCFKPCPPCPDTIVRNIPCGHQKELECFVDINQYDCLEVCQRLVPAMCGHTCQNLCFQPCGPCQATVKKRSPCGHSQNVKCPEQPRKDNCVELVRPRTVPVCGHRDTLVPCKYDSFPPEELAKYCQKPCNHVFNPAGGSGCSHQCKGTCSMCLQGRIHMKCQADCGKQLVCGHVCEVPCSAVCPPCKKPCLMKCEHSECKMKCGEPCSNCKEKCGWVCPHKKCTKLCGEMCDRDPCKEPCEKKLKCSHDYVGFCGETCPPLCRTCDKDELTSIFFGNEDDEDARFVFLEDCGHTIEVEGLEGWINISGSNQISAKRCPICKTPIRNCRRFGNLIRQHYKDVTTVKMRAFGNKANTERLQNKWIAELNSDPTMERIFPQLHGKIRDNMMTEVQLKHGIRLTPKRNVDEFSMRSLDFIADSASKVAKDLFDLRRNDKLVSPHYEKVLSMYRKTLNSLIERQPLSRQEMLDYNEELDRLDYYKQLMMRRSLPVCSPTHISIYRKYKQAKEIVTSALPFTYTRKEEFKRLLKELDELSKSGLGISLRERQEILGAMGLSQGHWFKCRNGHIYAIDACGGAMQESVCNECGAGIGGGDHRLRQDNQLAGEMDGAVAPAWPGGLH